MYCGRTDVPKMSKDICCCKLDSRKGQMTFQIRLMQPGKMCLECVSDKGCQLTTSAAKADVFGVTERSGGSPDEKDLDLVTSCISQMGLTHLVERRGAVLSRKHLPLSVHIALPVFLTLHHISLFPRNTYHGDCDHNFHNQRASNRAHQASHHTHCNRSGRRKDFSYSGQERDCS
jgi:hypothetical protein